MDLFEAIFDFIRTMWIGVVDILNTMREIVTENPLIFATVAALGALVALTGASIILVHRFRRNR